MAIAWIKEVRNYHPTATLSLRCEDGRHPTLGEGADRKEYGRDDTISVLPAKSSSEPTILKADNFAIPWSFNFSNRLRMSTEINKQKVEATAEIRGESAWDFILIRDHEMREIEKIDAGSCGDAPGVNHSWWILSLHSDGDIEFHCLERQGLLQDEAMNLGRFFLSFLLNATELGVSALEVYKGHKKEKAEKEKAKA
ncbi:hypothetical protein [Chitinilyticum litopenaei]|uniref:hypothetical protein n=1 Tax=Chitinilyticum litopenaei TaxID=1121276 RepID=UPI0003F5DF7C|nr:hypothetical protein [Chitinilyticum litopenaei]